MWKVLDRGQPPQVRFWNRVVKGEGCWEWIGRRLVSGYGVFLIDRIEVRAHRYSWQIHFGSIPAKEMICHKCDNPSCVRPDHLFIGDQYDNMRDAAAKGRTRNVPMPGMAHPLAKLTDMDVLSIRRIYHQGGISQKRLAIRYSISQSVVRDIVLNRGWKHLL